MPTIRASLCACLVSVRSTRAVRFLTAEEASQVADEVSEIFQRYEDKRYDPSLRPAGALPVEFAYFEFPRTEFGEDT